MAYEWGVSPLVLEEMELLEVGYYIIGRKKAIVNEWEMKNEMIDRKTYNLVSLLKSVGIPMTDGKNKMPEYEKVYNKKEENKMDRVMEYRRQRWLAQKNKK